MTEDMDLLLNEIYFVTPYDRLVDVFPNEEELQAILTQLLMKNWASQMQFKDENYVHMEEPDYLALSHYAYLATRAGMLMQHDMERI